jgi:multicomponent Na+:H+ antiporter subunit E
MKRFISVFLLSSVLWLLWSGMLKPLMLFFGLTSCLLVALIVSRLHVVDKNERTAAIFARLVGYAPWLIVEIVKSNIDVAKRIWRPDLPISPTIVTVKASQDTALGLVIHANSITLTPGTLSIDVEPGLIEVHALSADSIPDLESGEMDRRVARLEGKRP